MLLVSPFRKPCREKRYPQRLCPDADKGDQKTIMQEKENNAVIYQRIGKTTYKLRVHLKEAGETMGEKILRLIANEVVTNAETRGIMGTLQMTQPLGRSSQ